MSEEERLQLENQLLMTCSKAQAINKYIDELEESSKLSELWCESQQENKRLKEVIKEVRKYIEECSSREIRLDIREILDKTGDIDEKKN